MCDQAIHDLLSSTGSLCDQAILAAQTDSSDESNVGVIVACIVIIMAIIVAVLIYVYWYFRKARRMKGRYKPSRMEQFGPGIAPGIPLDKMVEQSNGERLIWQDQGGGETMSLKMYTFLWLYIPLILHFSDYTLNIYYS